MPTPVAITAGTVYVASYLAPVGRYAGDAGYFATTGVDNGPLHALKDERPLDELFFITGADAILQILTWRDPEAVLREARFIAATRPGYDLDRLEKELPEGLEDRVVIMEIPALAISSTDVRLRARESRPIRYLVPAGVAEYIEKNELYR